MAKFIRNQKQAPGIRLKTSTPLQPLCSAERFEQPLDTGFVLSASENAHCKFLETAYLDQKVKQEVAKKRQFMIEVVSETVDYEDNLTKKIVEKNAEYHKLWNDLHGERIVDEQLDIFNGLQSSDSTKISIDNLNKAAKASMGFLRTENMVLPKCKSEQDELDTEISQIGVLLESFKTVTDPQKVLHASQCAEVLNSCVKRQETTTSKLKKLVVDVKDVTTEAALLRCCELIEQRAAGNNGDLD